MFDILKATDTPQTHKLIIAIGLVTGGLMMVHYYHQIKLTRLQIKEHEEKYVHQPKKR